MSPKFKPMVKGKPMPGYRILKGKELNDYIKAAAKRGEIEIVQRRKGENPDPKLRGTWFQIEVPK